MAKTKEEKKQAIAAMRRAHANIASAYKDYKEEDAIIPNHYGGAANPLEVIKVLRHHLTQDEFIGAMNFNIVKYSLRWRKKNGIEDLKKANYYSNYLIEYLKEG